MEIWRDAEEQEVVSSLDVALLKQTFFGYHLVVLDEEKEAQDQGTCSKSKVASQKAELREDSRELALIPAAVKFPFAYWPLIGISFEHVR